MSRGTEGKEGSGRGGSGAGGRRRGLKTARLEFGQQGSERAEVECERQGREVSTNGDLGEMFRHGVVASQARERLAETRTRSPTQSSESTLGRSQTKSFLRSHTVCSLSPGRILKGSEGTT